MSTPPIPASRPGKKNLPFVVGLVIVLVLAAILRLWGIGFGLPQRFHVDEPAYVLAALKLASGQLHIDYPMLSPNIHQFILLFEYGILFIIGRISGAYHSVSAFAQSYQVDPTPFYILSRLTSVFFSVLTVGLTYLLGRKLIGAWGGLAAAFFLAVFLPDIRQAHFGEPYALISFFALASVYAALLYHADQRLRLLFLSGALAGAALALRFSLAPLVLAPGLAVLTAQNSRPPAASKKKNWFILLVYTGLSVLGGFVLAYPGVLINPKSLLTALGLYSQSALANNGFEGFIIAPWSSWGFYLRVLLIGVGLPALAAALVGLVWWAIKRPVVCLVVMVFPVLFFLMLGVSKMFFTRYTIPLMPFIALAAAFVVVQISALLQKTRLPWKALVWQAAVSLLLCAAFIIVPMRSNLRLNALLTAEDTRTEAKSWIEANIPAGASIAEQWFTPDLAEISDPASVPGPHYQVTSLDPFVNGAKLYSLDEFRKKGVQYIILSSFIENLPRFSAKEEALRQSFYQSLASQAQLVAEFQPDLKSSLPGMTLDEIYGPLFSLEQRSQPGPTLKIYRITSQNQ